MNRPSASWSMCVLACWALLAPAVDEARPGDALTLAEAIRLALAHAPEISLADIEIARAGEALRESRALSRPKAMAGTGLAYNNGFPLSIEGAAPSAFQIGVSQSLFSKQNRNLVLEAEQGVKARRIGSERARDELAARAALVYYELHSAREAADLWVLQHDAAARELRLMEALLEAGRARPVDKILAATASANAQYQLLVYREQARMAESELREMTGLPEGAPIRTLAPRLEPGIFALPAEKLFDQALENHPEIRQAEANLRAREFHVEAEKGGRYPRLELVSQYALFTRFNNYQDYFNRFSRNNFLFGLSVQVPLFDGFQTSARVAQSLQEAAAARLQLQRLKSALRIGIERSAGSLRIAQGAEELARQELEAARELRQVHQALMEGGRAGAQELSDSQNRVRAKEIALLEAQKILFQRRIELLEISGTISSIH